VRERERERGKRERQGGLRGIDARPLAVAFSHETMVTLIGVTRVLYESLMKRTDDQFCNGCSLVAIL
jgi:hypothetical protein